MQPFSTTKFTKVFITFPSKLFSQHFHFTHMCFLNIFKINIFFIAVFKSGSKSAKMACFSFLDNFYEFGMQ